MITYDVREKKEIMFSIIVPVFNAEEYLDDCIKSIIKQTYKAFEIILVDDGSTDASTRICQQYSCNYSYINLIRQENKGIAAARNCGLDSAIGDYILFVDSDDLWSSVDLLKRVEEIIIKDKCQMLQFSYCKFYDGNKEKIKHKLVPQKEHHASSIEEIIKSGTEITTNMWTKVFEKNFLKENNLYMDENLITSQDIDFSFKVWTKVKKVSIIPDSLYAYRIRKGSLSCNNKTAIRRMYIIEKWTKYNFSEVNNAVLEEYIMSKIAYQYMIMLSTTPRIQQHDDRKKLLKNANTKKGILKFSKGCKAKIMSVVCNLFGITVASYLFYFVNLIKKR